MPQRILDRISDARIKRIHWVSFGCHLDSWFILYETPEGRLDYDFGSAIPRAADRFLSERARPDRKISAHYVQLGDAESFVAWTKSHWACSYVPEPLRHALCRMSSEYIGSDYLTTGYLTRGTLDNVQWHRDGSFYVKSGDRHIGYYQADITRKAWAHLWSEGKAPLRDRIQAELAVSFRNPLRNDS